ncbi:MAG: hypothetical protein PGN25_00925 [Methylorubrum populi]
MQTAHTELDGQHLRAPGTGDVWLVFHGLRHRVVTPLALLENDHATEYADLETIAVGPELSPEARLLRPAGLPYVYLVFGAPKTIRCLVATLETFLEFRFSASRVVDVPPIVLDAIPVGPELQGAADRLNRDVSS